MKLANINNDVANNFLTEGAPIKEEIEDEEVLDDFPAGDEGPVDDAPLDDMGDMDDMDDMGDMADEPGVELSEEDALQLVDAIVDAIGEKTGIEFETSMGGEEEPAMDADFDAVPAGDEGDDLDADLEVMDEDEIVNETLRRVTHRLNAANGRNKVINEAMRRIQVRYGRSTR